MAPSVACICGAVDNWFQDDRDIWRCAACRKTLRQSIRDQRRAGKRLRRGVRDVETFPKAVRLRIKRAGGKHLKSRRSVALALSEHFQATFRAWQKARAIGFRGLAEKAGVDVKTCRSVIAWLHTEGLLDIVELGIGRRGTVYRWSDYVRNYKYRRPTPMKRIHSVGI